MRFYTLIASAILAGLAIAQETSKLAFTSTPANVETGKSYEIKWDGGDDDLPVTIALRKGDIDTISTVQILTTNGKGGSFSWTPNPSLIDGDDYTLQITQGLDSINYSGEISLSGGIDPVSASISSILASASSAIASANATISALAPITSLMGATATPDGSSIGTSTNIPRNTTFSSATLGATATATTSEAAATTSAGTNGAHPVTARNASPMALFYAILAAVAYAI